MRSLPAPSAPSETSVLSLAIAWMLMVPLFCVASDGVLWFRQSADITLMSATYGSLASSGSNSTDNAAIGALLFFTVGLAIFPRLKAVWALFRQDRVFLALMIWLLLSCAWSQFPEVSIRWAPIAAINIIFAVYLYVRFKPEQQMRLFLALGWVCLLLSFTLAVFFPRYGIDPTFSIVSWRGMYSQKNLCSMVTLFLLPGAFCVPTKGLVSKLLRVVYVALSIVLIFMTQSATGRLAVVCLLVYFAAIKLLVPFSSRERTVALVVGALVVAVVVVGGVSAAKEIAVLLNRDPTLTGRTDIWAAILPSALKRPILGYGYVGFWRGFEGESANVSLVKGWSVTSAHNGLLEMWLDLGLVGVGLVLFALFRALRDAFIGFRRGSSPYLSWCTCMIFLTIVISVDEGEFLVASTVMRILFIIACLGLSEAASKIRTGQDYA
jgi:exopolysaccharide production protein ExoQ